jgi:hypothetical protein
MHLNGLILTLPIKLLKHSVMTFLTVAKEEIGCN